MKREDILLDENGDLLFANGDFVIADSNNQHVDIIFDCVKGEIRENPSLGFAAMHLLKTNKTEVEVKRSLRVELNKDGYTDAEITINKELGIMNINVEQ